MKKKQKDNRPGIRVPTAKGSIRHKSKKDYKRSKDVQCCTEYFTCDYHKEMNRKAGHVSVWDKFAEVIEDHSELLKKLKDSGEEDDT